MNPSSFDTRSMGLCGTVGTETLYSSQMKDVSHDHHAFVMSWKYVNILITSTTHTTHTHQTPTPTPTPTHQTPLPSPHPSPPHTYKWSNMKKKR